MTDVEKRLSRQIGDLPVKTLSLIAKLRNRIRKLEAGR